MPIAHPLSLYLPAPLEIPHHLHPLPSKTSNILYSKATCTAKEGTVRIQYKCLVPSYLFPEIKLSFPKQNYNVLSPRSHTHISVRDLYISRIGLPILLQGNMWTDPGNIYVNRSQTHECGNWD
jgi:hypothetical protein